MAVKKKDAEDAGAPAWVMTFADLMSLLMCFFVLLLSFSELDRKKYKQVAGSMSAAFGVQREVPTQESPKGVTIIAQDFAPGKPQPTLERVLKQETTDDTQDYLEVLEAIDRVQEKSYGDERGLLRGNADSDQWIEGAAEGEAGGSEPRQQAGSERSDPRPGATSVEISPEALAMEQALRSALEDARKQAEALRVALKDEIDEDLLDVEAKEQGVLIKVREHGSFPSGEATLHESFLPVLQKIAGALITDTSKLVVAGHTDDVPITTSRFPSNWELSAGRASSVLQGFIAQKVVARERLELRAFADTEPLVPNTSSANRAQNRRVEIFINTMPDDPEKAAANASEAMRGDRTLESIGITGEVEPGEEFEL